MNTPRHALLCWEEIAGRISRAGRLSLFADFDGTLVPIRKHPDRIWLSPKLQRLLRALAHSGVTLGIVSGRQIGDLRRRVGLGRIWYVGVHGYFLRGPGNRSTVLLSPSRLRKKADFL